MASGAFHTPVLFQRAASTRDAAGQPNQTFTDLVTDGARISTVSGQEAVDAGLETAESGLQVTVRYGPTVSTVTANDRMVIRGKNYDITYAEPNFDRRYILFVGRAER